MARSIPARGRSEQGKRDTSLVVDLRFDSMNTCSFLASILDPEDIIQKECLLYYRCASGASCPPQSIAIAEIKLVQEQCPIRVRPDHYIPKSPPSSSRCIATQLKCLSMLLVHRWCIRTGDRHRLILLLSWRSIYMLVESVLRRW